MPRFEVFCPAAPPALPEAATLRVDAEHWVAALEAGLRKLGVAVVGSNVLCDVQADGSIQVTDPRGGGVFRIRELRAEPAAPRATPPPAPPAGAAAPAGPIGRPGAAPPPRDALAEAFARADGAAGLDRAGGIAFLLDLALEQVDAEAGSVLLARPGGELEFAAARGPRARELLALRAAVPVGVGLAGFCVREDVCVAVSDAEKDPRFHRAISEAIGYETRSLLCAPIARRGHVVGALEVLNKRRGAPFGPRDLAVVAYLAHRLADHLARG